MTNEATEMSIRTAAVSDAERLLEIYGFYVEKTAVSFEYEIPSIEEFRKRIENTLKKYPYIVLEENGRIIGYAYAGAFHPRAAFAWCTELTVYLEPGCRKRGCGRMLYDALEVILKKMGIINVYACVAYPETEDEYLTMNSLDFHRHIGFETVGKFPASGYKFGRWYGIAWLEKIIGSTDSPGEVIPFPAVCT